MQRPVASQSNRSRKEYKRICSGADRGRWRAARAASRGLGASDAATVLGVNPYESAYTLFQRLSGNVPFPEDNEYMTWGRLLEDVIAMRYAELHRVALRNPNTRSSLGGWLLRSRKYPWLYATPDRDGTDERGPLLIEIKTGGERTAADWDGNAPVHYQVQLQQQMLVTGVRRGVLCGLLGGNDFRVFEYEFDAAFCEQLIRHTRAFWKRVESGDEPEPDDSPSTYHTLRAMSQEGRAVELPTQVYEWWQEVELLGSRISDLDQQRQELKRRVAAYMGRATHGVFASADFGALGCITFKEVQRGEYTVPATTYRQLRYSKKLRM